MSFEDLITPEMVNAAIGYGTVYPRPPGPATVGLTAARKVVFLKGLTRSKWLKDPIEKVSGSGWTRWYPVNQYDFDEILARDEQERNARKGKRKPKGFTFNGDVDEPEGPPRNRHPWN